MANFLCFLSKKITMSTRDKNKTNPIISEGNNQKKEPAGKDKKSTNNTGPEKGNMKKNVSRHPTTEPNPAG